MLERQVNMFHKLFLIFFVVFLNHTKAFCVYDTCDCLSKSEQKFEYLDSLTVFSIFCPKTELCPRDTLSFYISITNVSKDTICIFKELKLKYNDKEIFPNILVNIGNNFTSSIDYSVDMIALGPKDVHKFNVNIPVSTLLEKQLKNEIVVNLGYGYLPRIYTIRNLAHKRDKYFLKSNKELNVSSMLVEYCNKSYDNALFRVKICR